MTIIPVLHAKTYIQVIYQLMFKCPEVIERISRNSLTFILPSHDYWMFVKEVQYLVQCFITVLLSSFIIKFFYYKLGTDSLENFIPEWNGVPGIKKRIYRWTSVQDVIRSLPRTKLLLKVKQVKTFENKALKKLKMKWKYPEKKVDVTVNRHRHIFLKFFINSTTVSWFLWLYEML